MIDQRPIKPDQKYLQQYIQKISQVETKPYLKKKAEALLPCQQHQLQKYSQISNVQSKTKTKAEIYEDIKLKNKLKFGEKKFEEPKIPQNKKLDPKKMTVNYKPKKQTKIQIQQYKKKGKQTQKARSQLKSDPKIEYDKLLDYYKQELNNFQKQKEQFAQVAGKLKFKEMISREEGLTFAKIKQKVQQNLITQQLSENFNVQNVKTVNQGHLYSHRERQDSSKLQHCSKDKHKQNVTKNMTKTYSVVEIRNHMNQTQAQMKYLKQKLLHKDVSVRQYRYDISQIHLLPFFSPKALYQYITPNVLNYNCNGFYRKAILAFHSKFKKENEANRDLKLQDMDVIHQYQQQAIEKDVKVKFMGEKRVMKYHGWTEVWIPGRQRLMSNGQGYKIVWLSNGDVMQQFLNQISTYYSKSKQINKILYKNMNPIYFSKQTGQLWWFTQDHKRQVVFENGRQEILDQPI